MLDHHMGTITDTSDQRLAISDFTHAVFIIVFTFKMKYSSRAVYIDCMEMWLSFSFLACEGRIGPMDVCAQLLLLLSLLSIHLLFRVL